MYIYARFHIFSFTNTIYIYKSKRLQYVQVGDFLKNPNAKIWNEKNHRCIYNVKYTGYIYSQSHKNWFYSVL